VNTAEKESLLKEWIKFKKAESKAKSARVEVEGRIQEIYGLGFDGNSKTFKEDDLGFSINLKKNVVYSLDQEKWKSVRNEIPENIRPEKITFSIDVEGFNYLQGNEELVDTYKKVSDCVTIKENKPSVKVEKL